MEDVKSKFKASKGGNRDAGVIDGSKVTKCEHNEENGFTKYT